MAIASQDMVANSSNSVQSASKPTTRTSKVKPDDVVTAVDVAEFLRSTVSYAQSAGVKVLYRVNGDMLVLGFVGLTMADGQIAPLATKPEEEAK